MYFRNYRLRNTSLDKCLKSPFSRGPFDRRHCKRTQIRRPASSPDLMIAVKVIEIAKVSRSDVQNVRTLCQHIDC